MWPKGWVFLKKILIDVKWKCKRCFWQKFAWSQIRMFVILRLSKPIYRGFRLLKVVFGKIIYPLLLESKTFSVQNRVTVNVGGVGFLVKQNSCLKTLVDIHFWKIASILKNGSDFSKISFYFLQKSGLKSVVTDTF